MSDAKSTARLDKRYLYNNADQIDTSRFTGLTSPLWQKYGYDSRGRFNSQAGTGKMEMELRYHHNSNISETYFSYDGTTGLPQNEIEYGYDGLNRLTAATEKREQAFSEEYTYDPDGNILTKIRSNPGNGTFKEMYYNYESGTNQLDWLAIADDNMGYYEANYSTDSRGNITADEYRSTSNFTYDHRNLPLQLSANGTTVKYSYDDNGNRIYKEFSTTKEFYLRDHTGQELALFKVSGSADTLMFYHIYGLGLEGRTEQTWSWNYETEPPQIERSDEPYYYIKDHLGTIRVTINKQGTILFAADYWPYGEKMAEYNAGGNTGQRYIFTEKERDTETGYDYFGARFYDSDLGRWMTVDPLMDKYPGWNPYNYTLNNPLKFIDPNGMYVSMSHIHNEIHGRMRSIDDIFGFDGEGGDDEKRKKKEEEEKKKKETQESSNQFVHKLSFSAIAALAGGLGFEFGLAYTGSTIIISVGQNLAAGIGTSMGFDYAIYNYKYFTRNFNEGYSASLDNPTTFTLDYYASTSWVFDKSHDFELMGGGGGYGLFGGSGGIATGGGFYVSTELQSYNYSINLSPYLNALKEVIYRSRVGR